MIFIGTDPKALELFLDRIDKDGIKLNHHIWECACVDAETEIFTKNGWKAISEYDNEEILISDINSNCFFEKPLKYIKTFCNKWYYYKSLYLKMCLSEGHKVLYKNNHNIMKTRKIEDIAEKHTKSVGGFKGKIPIGFNYSGNLKLNEWELRLAIAVQADGCIRSSKKYIDFKVKKQRKKERIEFLLEKAKINYEKKESNGYYCYTFYSPLGLKEFPNEWYNLCLENKQQIIDEIFLWDGHVSKDKSQYYSTNSKRNADFIQFVISSSGYSSNIIIDNRMPTKNINYKISLLNKTYTSLHNDKKSKRNFIIENETKSAYCFTVSTGFFLCRKNNFIFITGNCGEGNLSEV